MCRALVLDFLLRPVPTSEKLLTAFASEGSPRIIPVFLVRLSHLNLTEISEVESFEDKALPHFLSVILNKERASSVQRLLHRSNRQLNQTTRLTLYGSHSKSKRQTNSFPPH